MPERYFVDTCIWRDFYENRLSKSGNPLGKYAAELFMKILKDNDKILFSESLVWELKKDYNNEEINEMLSLLFVNKVLFKVEITKEEHLEAKSLSFERGIPFADCLNAVQARNNNAVIVSQDEHFQELRDIAKIIKPQEIN